MVRDDHAEQAQKINRQNNGVSGGISSFIIGVRPWPECELVRIGSLQSWFGGDELKQLTYSDFGAPEDARYAVFRQTGNLHGIDRLPLHLFFDEVLPMDESSEEELLLFAGRRGLPLPPYFDSWRRATDRRRYAFENETQRDLEDLLQELEAELEGRRGFPRRLLSLVRGDSTVDEQARRRLECACYIASGLRDLENRKLEESLAQRAVGKRSGGSSDGFCALAYNAAYDSERIRRELEFRGGVAEGEIVVSLSEMSLALRLCKETVCYLIAKDVAKGDDFESSKELVRMGLEPRAYLGRTLSANVDFGPFGERGGGGLASGAKKLTHCARVARFDDKARLFVDATLRSRGVFVNVLPRHMRLSASCPADPQGGICEAVVVQALWVMSLELEWRKCPSCGKMFKRQASANSLECDYRHAKEAETCSPTCQKRARRATLKAADELAERQIADEWRTVADVVAKKSKLESYLEDIREKVEERFPPKRKGDAAITISRLRELYEARVRYLEDKHKARR